MTKPTDSKPTTHSGRQAELSAKSEKKPTVTRPSTGSRRCYVVSKPQTTHSGMLHQSRTLEETAVDKPQDRHETGGFKGSSRNPQLADNMVEVSEPASAGSVTTTLTGSEIGAVTRPFVLGRAKRPLMPGDLVTASVPSGVNVGRHTGRVAVRASGSFNIQSTLGTAQGISHKHCRKLQQADGYAYQQSTRGFPSALKDRVSSTSFR